MESGKKKKLVSTNETSKLIRSSLLRFKLMKNRCSPLQKGVLKIGGLAVYMAMLIAVTGSLPPAFGAVTVVTTTTQVTDMVGEIGEPEVTVLGLMGPGVDPHLYKPSAGDVAKLRKADVIFYSGLMLEGRMADLFLRMARNGASVYAVTERIPKKRLLAPEEFEGHWDPHVWFDPSLWVIGIDVIVEALSAVDPENAEVYRERGAALRKEYLEVHEWAQARIAEIPKERRILITSHDAFNYFATTYDYRVVAVQGISTVTEAGLADIAKTVDFIKAHNVKAIFVESSVSPATIQRIAQDSGVVVGGEIFSDAMDAPGTIVIGPDGVTYDKGTWPGMVKHNIHTIIEALR